MRKMGIGGGMEMMRNGILVLVLACVAVACRELDLDGARS